MTNNSPENDGNYTAIISAEVQPPQDTTSADMVEGPSTSSRTGTESTLITESTLEGSIPDISPLSFSQSQTTQGLTLPIEDLENRFVSTFRGRTIHGLTINLPDGYTGVVLKAKSEPDGYTDVSSFGTNVQRTSDVEEVEIERWGQKRRGRLRSSAAPRQGTVITISDDDNDPLNSFDEPHDDVEISEPFATPNEFDGPLRILVPTARFDSFTLWQADRMVNKSNDEYWRTLTDWIGLSHAVWWSDCCYMSWTLIKIADSRYSPLNCL